MQPDPTPAQPSYAYAPYHGYSQHALAQQPATGYDPAYYHAAYGYQTYADPSQQQQTPPWQLDLQQSSQPQQQPQYQQLEPRGAQVHEEQAPGTHQPPQLSALPPPEDADGRPALPPDSPPPLPPLPEEPEPAQAPAPPVTIPPPVPASQQPPSPPQSVHHEYDPTASLSPEPSPQAGYQQQQQQQQGAAHSAPQYAEPAAQAAYAYQQGYAPTHAQAYASPQPPGYGAYGYAPAEHMHAGAWHEQGAMGMSAPYWPHMHQASYQVTALTLCSPLTARGLCLGIVTSPFAT